MTFSAARLHPPHSSAGFIQLPQQQGIRTRNRPGQTDEPLFTVRTHRPPTHINYNYISSFLLFFFFSLHLFKTAHCHFIYLPESCTNLSLNQMIYPRQEATVWIMCSNCSLFCFNWIFLEGRRWAATSRQCFISFYRHKDRNVWSEKNMTAQVEPGIEHMQPNYIFPGGSRGGTTLVRSVLDRLSDRGV